MLGVMENVDKVRELSETNKAAHYIFRALASRERPRDITDLRRLRKQIRDEDHVNVDGEEFMRAIETLQKLGFGKLIVGRGTAPDRFKWKFNNVELGRAALGKPLTKQLPGKVSSEYSDDIIPIHYPLRGQLMVLPLPKDLTKSEAKELAEFILRFGR